MKRGEKIYATKKRLLQLAGEAASQRYVDGCHVGDAMHASALALCECAVASHQWGVIFVETSDGMEWRVQYEKFGRRNPKTGHIDKRIKRLPKGAV